MGTNLPNLLANGLAAVFAIAAIVDLVGYQYILARLGQERYPRQFYRVMGVLQLITAVFLATPLLRIWGITLAGLISFFWVVTLLNHRQWSLAAAGILMMIALVSASLAIN